MLIFKKFIRAKRKCIYYCLQKKGDKNNKIFFTIKIIIYSQYIFVFSKWKNWIYIGEVVGGILCILNIKGKLD